MSTNKQSEELEKQLAKMKAEAEAKDAAAAEAKAKKVMNSLLLSELNAKKFAKIIRSLDSLSGKQRAELIDVDYYVQQRNANYPNLAPIHKLDKNLSEWGVDAYRFVNGDSKYIRLVFENFTLECVDRQGGGEGEGEHWHSVIKAESRAVPGTSRYFYIPGYYSSYDGTSIDYDYAYEVEPFEKVVIDWKEK